MSATLVELLRQAQSGDRTALNELLHQLRPHLESVARHFADPARPSESVSDLVQEAGVLAWRNLSDFRGAPDDDEATERQLLGWLTQILRRAGVDKRRMAHAQRRSPSMPMPRRVGWCSAPGPCSC